MPEGEELPDEVLIIGLARYFSISPLEIERWPYPKRQRYLALTNDIEAGARDRQEIEKFRQGNSSTGDDGGLSPAELKALQEEAENKYGRWQS